ncbi:hypothetical protein A8L35_02190 [Yersinia enterocolitica subsp. palearctica]|nr:hypothetical protein [Yersinia enterocolitica]OAM70089.1 hypothetical protein A8L35_02190 [Yersinia enterocolitica subsp. palearctica]EKN5024848.1 hypothetical protein [Yersinia enterocolitica]EKN5054091.1 hypothetical protein [Yersinia enterocolitica]EKN5079418.1 hypothetical protein [Yersinia enterocolitica]
MDLPILSDISVYIIQKTADKRSLIDLIVIAVIAVRLALLSLEFIKITTTYLYRMFQKVNKYGQPERL